MPVAKVSITVEQHRRIMDAAEKLGWLWLENPKSGGVVNPDWLNRSMAEVIKHGIIELEIRADRHVQYGCD